MDIHPNDFNELIKTAVNQKPQKTAQLNKIPPRLYFKSVSPHVYFMEPLSREEIKKTVDMLKEAFKKQAVSNYLAQLNDDSKNGR